MLARDRTRRIHSRGARLRRTARFALPVALVAVGVWSLALRLDDSRGTPNVARALAATKGVGIFGLGDRFSVDHNYDRYGYVVVDRSHARAVARIPGTSLVYMSGADIARFNTGVPSDRAAAKGWLLRDADGNVFEAKDYEHVQLADVGNRAYQREWLRNTLAFLRATKVDGVFIDDVMADMRSWSGRKEFPAKYPSLIAWQAAMASFMQAVGPPLKAKGYYVLANADGYIHHDSRSDSGATTVAWWRRLAPSVSGLLTEYWMQNPTDFGQLRAEGPEWYDQWAGWQRLVSVAQNAGVDFFGYMYGGSDDQHAMRYGKGSFLLDWNRKGGAFVYTTTDGSDPYHAAWATDLGRPLQPKSQIAPGVWRRTFARGVVVVNTTDRAVAVEVNGRRSTVDPVDALIASG